MMVKKEDRLKVEKRGKSLNTDVVGGKYSEGGTQQYSPNRPTNKQTGRYSAEIR